MAGEVATISNPSILSNPGQIQQWSNLIESLFGSSENRTTNTQSGSAADPMLMQLIQQLMGTSMQGANEANIQALIAPIMMQLRDQALPGIQQAANAGGGVFNSSTQKLLQNDALARATALGGEAVVKQQNQQQNQLMNLLNILAQSTKSTNQQQTASKPGTASNLGKAALGAAAASKLAKAFQNAKKPEYKGGMGRSDESDDTSEMGFKTGEEVGESVSGQYGEDKGLETDSWDSGNNGMDSIWDAFGDANAPDFEGNWDETGESVSGFWGGSDSGSGDGTDYGFWDDGSGGGQGGAGGGEEPETYEDLGSF